MSIRDSRDTIASIVEVAARLAKSGQKVYVVGDGRDVTTAANYFNAVYAPVLESFDRNPAFAEALLLVRYEDLCAKPLEVLPAIEQHCGIKLDAYDPGAAWSRSLVKDTSEWSTPLWGGKVSSDSVGRFRQVLQAKEVAVIESICSSFMARFGYPTT